MSSSHYTRGTCTLAKNYLFIIAVAKMFFSGSPKQPPSAPGGKKLNQHPTFDFIISPSRASRGASFLSFFFLFRFFEIFIPGRVKESFDRFSFIKFLSALIKLGRSWHPDQTELVNAAHSWSFVSSMKSSLVPHLSYYVWGGARNANTSKPPELLWRSWFGGNIH